MKCPHCHQDNDKVTDTRTSPDGSEIRRRRTCGNCGKRFTTFERPEAVQRRVVKRDGTRVPYNREKILQGLERACWKRKISDAQITGLITQVEKDVESTFEKEVDSRFIGERMMHYLAELDQVAYVRFASVYRHFESADDFIKELTEIRRNPDWEWSTSELLRDRSK
ncbi:MAG: transcriptional regulator NrdR [Planctomycetaceae bacterium]|jgi:transcriptional repressor NrdR|nr:transcriptional regulator NrdR [Planctomycetaceae bacterium]